VCHACQSKIGWYNPFDKKIRNRIRDETDHWNKIQEETVRVKFITKESIKKGSCCVVLKSHAELLKDDPERLSTDFIKKMSQCDCKKQVVD
jgi:diadenosine tetraphosphate (Ap4A) HIT family hydrolase